MPKKPTIQQVLKEAEEWMKLPGVEGVGEGKKNNKPCIVVLVSCNPAELGDKIPSSYKGYPVTIQETGPISIQ